MLIIPHNAHIVNTFECFNYKNGIMIFFTIKNASTETAPTVWRRQLRITFLQDISKITSCKNFLYDFAHGVEICFHLPCQFQLGSASHQIVPVVFRGKIGVSGKIIG